MTDGHCPLAQKKTKMGSTAKSPVAMNYFAQMQTEFKPPLIANENAFLGDVATSQEDSPETPMSAGFYRLEKGKPEPFITLWSPGLTVAVLGTPLVYEYTYDEMKICLLYTSPSPRDGLLSRMPSSA